MNNLFATLCVDTWLLVTEDQLRFFVRQSRRQKDTFKSSRDALKSCDAVHKIYRKLARLYFLHLRMSFAQAHALYKAEKPKPSEFTMAIAWRKQARVKDYFRHESKMGHATEPSTTVASVHRRTLRQKKMWFMAYFSCQMTLQNFVL